MFTEYQFDQAQVAARVAELKAGLRASRGFSDFAGFGLKMIHDRLTNQPARYVEFGPYWWALKAALRDAGYSYGDHGDALVLQAYRGATVEETLVMAEEFKEVYVATFFRGNRAFTLDAEGEPYELFDPDMEARPMRPQ